MSAIIQNLFLKVLRCLGTIRLVKTKLRGGQARGLYLRAVTSSRYLTRVKLGIKFITRDKKTIPLHCQGEG